MKAIDYLVNCTSRSDRFELFPIGDPHIGKRNCAEKALSKQVNEILRRAKMPHRQVAVIFGGDIVNAIDITDIRRFNIDDLADWFVACDGETTRERLGDMVNQEVNRAVEIFKPLAPYTIGAIYGNHEKELKKRHSIDAHREFCRRMDINDLTNEACIRLRFRRKMHSSNKGPTSTVNLYIRHGYGSGRTAGAEPNKLARMQAEWEWADICFSGHTHTFQIMPPKPVLYLPNKGKLPPQLLQRYRFAANWGCWLFSHLTGPGNYESDKCYAAKPMMTIKAVIWPFWSTRTTNNYQINMPKIEIRQYPIL